MTASFTSGSERATAIAITLEDTLAAVSLLLNAESCSRVSGTAEYRSWGKEDLAGPPKRTNLVDFVVDHELGTWSERDVKSRDRRRYSRETGQELVDDNGQLIPPKPPSEFNHWPLLIKLMRPTRFAIWGRPGDDWRMTGAESTQHGLLVHFDRSESSATAELFIDAHFSLPTRWTQVNVVGPNRGAKREVEIIAIHVPDAWKRKMGMDMSVEGEDRSFVIGDYQW
ncbi:hypothetical protein ACIGKQ_22400 [Gordonia sp. NPDC062954]|uniref:hypothetical protein n=1 Tax=Gordonia sp. NPDC062954 TaxID=3364003 RepID=UPI0037C64B14